MRTELRYAECTLRHPSQREHVCGLLLRLPECSAVTEDDGDEKLQELRAENLTDIARVYDENIAKQRAEKQAFAEAMDTRKELAAGQELINLIDGKKQKLNERTRVWDMRITARAAMDQKKMAKMKKKKKEKKETAQARLRRELDDDDDDDDDDDGGGGADDDDNHFLATFRMHVM